MEDCQDNADVPSAASERNRRRQAMIDAAREMFAELGYARMSMSALIAQVGGSKRTLWSYFPSKADLFEAVVADMVKRYGAALKERPFWEGDFREGLQQCGLDYMKLIVTPEVVKLFRTVVGEAGQFPEIAATYYENGPSVIEGWLQKYIERAQDEGVLLKEDAHLAALLFLRMCRLNHYQRLLFNLSNRVTQREVEADVDFAVSSFMKLYAS